VGLDCDDDDPSVSCVAEFGVGNAAEFGDSSTFLPNYLLGSAFRVPRPGMTVTTLALIGKAAGGNVKMALYKGDAAGEPDELMVATAPVAVPDGVLEIPVAATRLSAGQYWIMAVYDEGALVGVQRWRHGYRPAAYRALDFSDPLPSTFGTPITFVDVRYNYYLLAY
jgi:hypothetical protein